MAINDDQNKTNNIAYKIGFRSGQILAILTCAFVSALVIAFTVKVIMWLLWIF